MQPKSKSFIAAIGILVVGSLFAFEADRCFARQLTTESTVRPQAYGSWTPPGKSSPVNSDALFPRAKPGVVSRRNLNEPPLKSQKPFAMSTEPLRARPLQPISSNRMLQGRFTNDGDSNKPIATVNHHEVSTRKDVLPLPRITPNWQSNAASTSQPDSSSPWLPSEPETNTNGGAGTIVKSVQNSMENVLSGFESKGSWGEKITGFFGGSNLQLKKIFGSLAIVIGGYLGFVWLMKRLNLSTNRGIPTEVIEVIGSVPFGARKTLQLVRLGSKLLLLMNSQDGTQPVGEITDAGEVEYLISLCRGRRVRASSSVKDAVRKFAYTKKDEAVNVAKMLTPSRPASNAEGTFSTSQLIQALQSLQNSTQQDTIFEA